jgi:hypothetical protein
MNLPLNQQLNLIMSKPVNKRQNANTTKISIPNPPMNQIIPNPMKRKRNENNQITKKIEIPLKSYQPKAWIPSTKSSKPLYTKKNRNNENNNQNNNQKKNSYHNNNEYNANRVELHGPYSPPTPKRPTVSRTSVPLPPALPLAVPPPALSVPQPRIPQTPKVNRVSPYNYRYQTPNFNNHLRVFNEWNRNPRRQYSQIETSIPQTPIKSYSNQNLNQNSLVQSYKNYQTTPNRTRTYNHYSSNENNSLQYSPNQSLQYSQNYNTPPPPYPNTNYLPNQSYQPNQQYENHELNPSNVPIYGLPYYGHNIPTQQNTPNEARPNTGGKKKKSKTKTQKMKKGKTRK